MAMMESTVDLRRVFEALGGDGRIEIAFPSAPAPRMDATPAPAVPPLPHPESTDRTGNRPAPGTSEPAEQARTESSPSETGACAEIPADIHSIAANWPEITARVGMQKPAIGASLAQGVPESYDHGKLAVRFNEEFHKGICEQYRGDIEEIIGTILGARVKLTCSVRRAAAERKRNNEVDDLIAREPIIKDILDRFDGEISDSWR
jgi:hypothetical protein